MGLKKNSQMIAFDQWLCGLFPARENGSKAVLFGMDFQCSES